MKRKSIHPFSRFNHHAIAHTIAHKDGDDDDSGNAGDDSNNGSAGGGGGAGTGGEPPAGSSPPSKTEPPEGDSDEVKALKVQLEKERKAREAREEEDRKREDAKKTDLERAEARAKLETEKAESANARLRAMEIENALRDAAASAGVKPERMVGALRLVNRGSINADSGEIVGAKAAIEDVKKDFPEFFGSTSTSSTQTGSGKPGDRNQGDGDEDLEEYDVGRAIAKQNVKTKKRL